MLSLNSLMNHLYAPDGLLEHNGGLLANGHFTKRLKLPSKEGGFGCHRGSQLKLRLEKSLPEDQICVLHYVTISFGELCLQHSFSFSSHSAYSSS